MPKDVQKPEYSMRALSHAAVRGGADAVV